MTLLGVLCDSRGILMDRYGTFKEMVGSAAERFKEIGKKETVRVISHLDADGITSCSILVRMLSSNSMRYSVSTVQQLTEEGIGQLAKEPYKVIVFSDLGSGMIPAIRQSIPDRTVFIIDHHELSEETAAPNIVHLNPHLCGIDGGSEISGAGVAYLFSRELSAAAGRMAHIALIGAIGDIQEGAEGFQLLNREILEEAIRQGSIKKERGLRLFGAQTRAIHKALEYCTDPYIPGISGSESGSIAFLHQLGINPQKEDGTWKKIIDLSAEELQRLTTGVIMRRLGEKKPEDVLGNIYLLTGEEQGSPLRDAKEFCTLLNACGRMNKASLGIGACLGDRRTKLKAIRHLEDYRKAIVSALKWFETSRGSQAVVEGEGFVIINAKDQVLPTMIGTLASILSKSRHVKDGSYILSLARNLDHTTKVSIRLAGVESNGEIDLRNIVALLADPVGGSAGGHQFAAGAIIATEKEEEFLALAQDVLSKKGMEEVIRN